MKDFLKKYWWCVIIIVFAPIVINYLLLIPTIGPVVGDDVHWLSFWGSYLAALIPTVGAFMILYIQRRDSLGENEKRRKENDENRNLQINILKYQQEMQWLNEKRDILIDCVMSLSRDNLIELSNKMQTQQFILLDIKHLLERLVRNDSRIGFMRVSTKTQEYNKFDTIRKNAYEAYREALLDIQEIAILFLTTDYTIRYSLLESHRQKGLISPRLNSIFSQYIPERIVLFQQNPADLANKIIDSLPDLMVITRDSALEYVRAEEKRITQLIINHDNP